MKAYIVRIWQDETGRLRGHVSDPRTEERILFRNWRELKQILAGSFAPPAREMIDTHLDEENSHHL